MSKGLVKIRRGISSLWTSVNPTLLAGEFGLDTTNARLKIGDGATAWTSLAYLSTRVITGTAAPTTEGVDGDFYFRTTTTTWYGPKASGTWPGGTVLIGTNGWSPTLAVVADGARYVLQIVGWVGGTGTPPSSTNQFIGPVGIVGSAAAAQDIRGATGLTGQGVPTGGTTGQVLAKTSGTDYATAFGNTPVDGTTLEITGNNVARIKDGGVSLVKQADIAQATFLMRAAGAGTGPPIAGTPAQAKTALVIVPGDVTGFDTQVRTNRLDQMTAPTGAVSMGSQKITTMADGTNANDAVTLQQLQASAEGRKDKDAVEWSCTGNITLSGLGTQANGEWLATLTAGDRILAPLQSTSADKGIYAAAAGAWTRTLDANTGVEITGATVLVKQGATLRGDTFRQSATVATIGTDPQTWVQIGEGDPITITAVGAAPNAQGASLSGQALTLQPASASFPGLVTAAQFVILSNTSGTNSGNVTLGAVGASPNANAATLTGQALNLELANGSFPGLVSAAQFTKLAGIATGATANSSDAFLLDRANHTGTQLAATVSDFATSAASASADTSYVDRTFNSGIAAHVRDLFARTVSNGWSTADTGQAWTNVGGSANEYNVGGGVGQHNCTTAGIQRRDSCVDAGSSDQDIYADFYWNSAVTGGVVYGVVIARAATPADILSQYRLELQFTTSGTCIIAAGKDVAGVGTSLFSLTTLNVGVSPAPVRVRFQVVGSTIRAKVWIATDPEPVAWGGTATDTSLTTGVYAGVETYKDTANTSSSKIGAWGNLYVHVPGPAVPVSGLATAVTNVIGDLDVYDNFGRTVPAGGWGTANTGQPWTPAGAAIGSVAGGLGLMTTTVANQNGVLYIHTGSTDQDIYADFTWASTVTGGTVEFSLRGRDTIGVSYYRVNITLTTSGTFIADLGKVNPTPTTLAPSFLSGAYTPGTFFRIRLQCRGTTISAKVWSSLAAEPAAWQASVTDSAITTGTAVNFDLFRGPGNTSVTPTAKFDNFRVFVPTDAVVNLAPSAVENRHLYPAAANTVKANPTNAVAVPTDVAVTANTFLARSSTGDLAAKAITDAGLGWLILTSIAAQTAALNAATTALQGMMSAQDKIRMGAQFDAQADLGYVGDMITTNSTSSCSTGAPTLITDSASPFTPFSNANYYVGKRITLAGAGASGAMYVGTITAVAAGTATVTPNISTTVTNRICSFGTDNTAAITATNTLINTTNALFPGIRLMFGQSLTNAYGFPTPVSANRTVQAEGIGGGHTADTGDYSRIGGTRLAWWGTSCDGGNAFGAFWTISPNGVQSIKTPAFRRCWLDCRNGDQNSALIGLKLASCQGWRLDDFFVMDPMAIGIWFDVDTDPTEAKDCTRGLSTNLKFRCLDNTSGPVAVTLTPTTTSSAVNIATAQSLTLAAANGLRSGSDYIWVQSNTGRPYLARYTGGGGTTTLTGVICSTEDSVHAPTTVSGSNVVQCSPSNSMAMYLNGGTGANTCCNTFLQTAISHGSTWGPAAVEFGNSDSNDFQSLYINGGTRAVFGAAPNNRMTKPGVRQNGSNVSNTLASRNNTFKGGDPGSLPTTNGGFECMGVLNTGALMVAPSGPTYWEAYQLGNGAPVPIVEQGASLFWSGNGCFREGGLNSLTANHALTAAVANVVNGCWTVVPPQGWQVGTRLLWNVRLSKTAVGTAWTLNVRQHSSLTAGGGTLIATVAFVATAAIDAGGADVELVCTAKGGSATALARYRAFHNLGTSAGLYTIGAHAPATSPSPLVAPANLAFEGPMTMTGFNGDAPAGGPTFLFLEIVPTTAATVMTVLPPSGLECLKHANP